ncbi:MULTISPECIES: site-specific integrase [Shewanella]|nr:MULTISPECIES: site-specific integrase [Shewanella]MCL2910736.1 site-specific integrase [Shewanella aquimarina]
MTSTYETLKNQVQTIIHHYHQMELGDWQSAPREEGEYVEWIEKLCLFKSLSTEASRLNRLEQSQRLVKEYFSESGQLLPDESELQPLVRQVCDKLPSIYQSLLHHKPLFTTKTHCAEITSDSALGTEPASNKTLSEVMQEYLSENQQKGWKAKTIRQYQHTLFISLERLGDLSVAALTRSQGRELRATLPRLIKGKYQADITRDGLQACLTDDDALKISVTTANNHMNRLREFFRWVESMGYIKLNPMPDDNLPTPKVSKQAKRDPITDNEAKQIFAHSLFSELKGTHTKKIQHPSHFWMPLIAAYSGMRLGEISQLLVDDIKQIKEVWCFVVQQTRDDQYLKTPNAARVIPIHSELLRIGLIEYVDYVRSHSGQRLFTNIRLIQGNYSNKPSEWFIEHFRDRLGLPKHVTPHAFRHSYRDKLSRMTANPEHIARLIGHAGNQYGGLLADDVSHLLPLVNGVNYDGATAHIKPIAPDIFHNAPAAVVSEEESA